MPYPVLEYLYVIVYQIVGTLPLIIGTGTFKVSLPSAGY